MSVIVNILCKGFNQPKTGFSNWLGRRLALRNKRVTLHESTRISPSALLNPRNGAISIGANSIVSPGAQIQGNVCIGDNSSVQSNTIIVGYGEPGADKGQVRIGNGVRIAANCMIIAGNHRFAAGKPIHEQGMEPANIIIEDDVWIGGSVNIIAGVTIGTGSVIGAGSVVTKDIPPMSVAVGAPAKVIKQRT